MDPLIELSLGKDHLEALRADASYESWVRGATQFAPAICNSAWRRALGRLLISIGLRVSGEAPRPVCE